jgi:hypothetical protein
MKTLLTGLLLAVASAQATPVVEFALGGTQISYTPLLKPVTSEDVPEWAKLPNARSWYEIRYGLEFPDLGDMVLVFRGVVVMDPGWRMIQWIDLVPAASSVDQNGENPEPGTFLLMAIGAALLLFLKKRRNLAS